MLGFNGKGKNARGNVFYVPRRKRQGSAYRRRVSVGRTGDSAPRPGKCLVKLCDAKISDAGAFHAAIVRRYSRSGVVGEISKNYRPLAPAHFHKRTHI